MEDNTVLDFRIARWRRDPFTAEALEAVDRLEKCSKKAKGGALEVLWALVQIAEKRTAEEGEQNRTGSLFNDLNPK